MNSLNQIDKLLNKTFYTRPAPPGSPSSLPASSVSSSSRTTPTSSRATSPTASPSLRPRASTIGFAPGTNGDSPSLSRGGVSTAGPAGTSRRRATLARADNMLARLWSLVLTLLVWIGLAGGRAGAWRTKRGRRPATRRRTASRRPSILVTPTTEDQAAATASNGSEGDESSAGSGTEAASSLDETSPTAGSSATDVPAPLIDDRSQLSPRRAVDAWVDLRAQAIDPSLVSSSDDEQSPPSRTPPSSHGNLTPPPVSPPLIRTRSTSRLLANPLPSANSLLHPTVASLPSDSASVLALSSSSLSSSSSAIPTSLASPRPARSKPITPFHKPKTLILDLDETLIHSTSRPSGIGGGRKGDGHMVEVFLGGRSTVYHVYKRPYVDYFLKKVSGWYTLVIFTASMQEYADPVIDWLDAGRGMFGRRLFRDSCVQHTNGAYIKDLACMNEPLEGLALIDNSPISYCLHQSNGIPIDGWFSDPNDQALLDLLPVLDSLRFTSDVRHVLGLRGF